MTSLYDIIEAIRNSIAKQCNHYKPSTYGSTMKYVGFSERTFTRYYECIVCRGIMINLE